MTRPEHRRAPRGTTTGEEGRFPHTPESTEHTAFIRAELVRRGEDASAAAVYRYALKNAATALGWKP